MNKIEERNALAGRIWDASRADEGTISATGANIVADALVTAGYTKPRTVTSVAELWKLQIGTVIRERHGQILEYQHPHWAETGLNFDHQPHVDWLPATILFTPAGLPR